MERGGARYRRAVWGGRYTVCFTGSFVLFEKLRACFGNGDGGSDAVGGWNFEKGAGKEGVAQRIVRGGTGVSCGAGWNDYGVFGRWIVSAVFVF